MENNNKHPAYFSTEALAKFASAQGKTLSKIICHLWQNATNKNDLVEIIDNIELHFSDGQKITIGCNNNGDGLDAIDFDAKQTAKELQEEFGDKIKIFAVNASTTKMWEDVIGSTLLAIQASKENDNYKSDSVMLNFGEQKRTLTISPLDGLIIDYFEED